MKIISRFLFLAFFTLLLTSCDPSHDIFFKNTTASNVKVKINLERKGVLYDLEKMADKDSIVFNLAKDSTASISLGIGTWTPKEIGKATNSIKAIEVETKDIKTIYKSKEAIHSILDKNVHGILFKSSIEINVE